MSLKELTWENHKKAERKGFAKQLMSGEIKPELYYKYIANQFLMYSVLEQKLAPILEKENIDEIRRGGKILEDMMELNQLHGFVYTADQYACEASKDYVKYISQKDPEELIPHLYVRHFGDMYGGAMIAKKIPGSGKMYEFDNKDDMKEKVRSMLNDDMADEANKCFEFAIRLFEELTDE